MIADLPYLALALLAYAVPTSLVLWMNEGIRGAGKWRWKS